MENKKNYLAAKLHLKEHQEDFYESLESNVRESRSILLSQFNPLDPIARYDAKLRTGNQTMSYIDQCAWKVMLSYHEAQGREALTPDYAKKVLQSIALPPKESLLEAITQKASIFYFIYLASTTRSEDRNEL